VRTGLPADVAPGAQLTVPIRVRVPRETGEYRLAWDVVQEHRLWFGAEPGSVTTFTAVKVEGAVVAGAPQAPASSRRSPAALPVPVEVPGRLVLWRAAVRMAADHPWAGVGPDNFRWRYGAYFGDAEADNRVHSNNMYLEVLTGGGVFAAATFAWFLCRLVGLAALIRSRLAGAAAAAYTGVIAAGVAFLAHGVLDSFLTFTPTAFASALMLGLTVAPLWWTESA
jgi:O-antigen ligase